MCGIVGILNLDTPEPVSEECLRQMLALIRHRGPDQFGIYLDAGVGLGNARLSIVDLSAGQQPISNESGTLWIVFNGEVFNHVELRPELEAKGHCFSTHTDTEVILHLFEEYGPRCLERLNGQFAIAIWDAKNRSLFLARDRLGVRPLYYTQAGGALLFGSEIKALLADPRVSAKLDPVGLEQVFTYWSTLSPGTVFEGVKSLPPGHFMQIRNGAVTLQRYWQPSFPSVEEEREMPTDAQAVTRCAGELRELLTDATRIRLRADVPVGAYLSGGLDSSLLAALTRNLNVSRLDTFSITFSDPKFDESEYQLEMARFLGTEHHVLRATHSEIGQAFPRVIWHAETPLMRTSPAPMLLLSELVKQHGYKVVLTGEGADEILAGYDIFKEAKVRRCWAQRPDSTRRASLLARLYPDIGNLSHGTGGFLPAFFRDGLLETERADYSHQIRWRNNRRTCRFFSEDLQATIQARRCDATQEPAIPPEFSGWGDLQKAQYLESSVFLSEYLLSSQGDRMGMANSVEGRFPFLDYRVVDFCNRLPARLKLRVLTEKYLLKKMAEPLLPSRISRRVKRPYRAPIHLSFLCEQAPNYVAYLLAPENLACTGYFKPAAVAQLVQKVRRGQISETDDMALAGILSTELWHRAFITDFKVPVPLSEKEDVKVCRQR